MMSRELLRSRRRLTNWFADLASQYGSDNEANAALAKSAGVSAEMVRRWRKEENWPGATALIRLHHRRGLDLNWLAGK